MRAALHLYRRQAEGADAAACPVALYKHNMLLISKSPSVCLHTRGTLYAKHGIIISTMQLGTLVTQGLEHVLLTFKEVSCSNADVVSAKDRKPSSKHPNDLLYTRIKLGTPARRTSKAHSIKG